jgi:hypothetical protein
MEVSRAKKIVFRKFARVGTEKLNAKKMEPSKIVRLGNKLPTMDELMQLIGIVLLLSAGLSGSEGILGKKCA